MSPPLITIDAALQALASANTPDELLKLANQAAAMHVYARRAKFGMAAQNRCAELRAPFGSSSDLVTAVVRQHVSEGGFPCAPFFDSIVKTTKFRIGIGSWFFSH